MKKITVCMVMDAVDGYRNGGSISTARFADHLRQLGHRVIIVATGEPADDKVVVPGYVPPIARKNFQFPMGIPKKKLLTDAIKQADIVHCFLPFWLCKQAMRIAKSLNKPCIATMYFQPEYILFRFGVSPGAWINKALHNFYLRTFYNHMDYVISCSEFGYDELVNRGLKPPCSVISNGIHPKFKPSAKPNDGLKTKQFLILSVGRLSAEKRQDVTIRAVANSAYRKQIQLVFIGVGPSETQYRNLAEQLLLKDQCQFLGNVPTDRLIEYYEVADLFIHAGELELECMTALEAMALGTTLLLANAPFSATPQFALDERSLFKHGDAEDLQAKIDAWLSGPEQLKQASEAYLQHAKNYSIDESIQQLLDVYNRHL